MNIIIISGERGEGKTTFIKEVAEKLLNKGIAVCGFYASHLMDSQNREGYALINILDGNSVLLCKRDAPEAGKLNIRDFWFDENTIQRGEGWLQKGFENDDSVYFLDEVGNFELEGYVWNDILQQILQNNKGLLIMTVRNKFVNKVVEKYQLIHHNLFIQKELLFTVEFKDKIERRQNG